VKKTLIASSLMLLAAIGCQDKKPATMQSSVTDLTPTPVAPAYVAPAPVAVQPVSYDTTTTSSTATPSYSSTSSMSGTMGNSYTVKKGDTLYGIAKKKYNDGKQWQKIASANPGLSPASLRVGQTITLPN
jgi:nucleoid-associated protein YgaU